MPYTCALCRASFVTDPGQCPLDGGRMVRAADHEERAGSTELRERAGRDSIASHWLGFDPWRGRVRVHLLSLPFEKPAGFAQWLNAEASAIGRIGHPAWETPMEIREAPDGQTVMLYPEAPEVGWDEYVSQAWPGQVPVDRVLAFGGLLFDAIAAAEAAGYVHAGLRPGKLCLRVHASQLSLHVVAPSMWKALQSMSATEPRFRKAVDLRAGYESPEVLRGQPRDLAADRWAAAAIIYELLTGYPPVQIEPVTTVLERLAIHGIAKTRTLRPDTPPLAAAVLDRALTLDASQRFASTADMFAVWHAASL